jgi:hypothetical protein
MKPWADIRDLFGRAPQRRDRRDQAAFVVTLWRSTARDRHEPFRNKRRSEDRPHSNLLLKSVEANLEKTLLRPKRP